MNDLLKNLIQKMLEYEEEDRIDINELQKELKMMKKKLK